MNQFNIKTIVFDWGNTLMQVLPGQPGPMCEWPDVKIVPNADIVLERLSNDYPIFVATNAEESSANDVKKAFDRVGLGKYIQKVFTFHELGAKKPDQKFFSALQDHIGYTNNEILFVGDDYQKDIIPSWRAGLRTCWFNPKNLIAKAHLPIHDYECDDLIHLPQLLIYPPIPSIQTCFSWYTEQQVTHSLMEHVQTVAAAAYQMAVWMRKINHDVSPLLTHRGAYLHDLAKLTETKEKNHAELAEEILMTYQQPELAKIAGRHLMGDLQYNNRRPQTWEEKLVHYADKLAEGNNLVSLSERLNALKNRYPLYANKIEHHRPLIEDLEREICLALSTTPEILLANLQNALFNGDKPIN